MALMTRARHDHLMESIDAAESCVSAAIAGSDYAGRVAHFLDDYTEIAEMFWLRCPITRKKMDNPGIDVRDIARCFHTVVIGCPISGLQSFKFKSAFERCRRKVKGQLFMTRMIMGEKDKKASCDDDGHTQPCKCKPLRLFELSEMMATESKQ